MSVRDLLLVCQPSQWEALPKPSGRVRSLLKEWRILNDLLKCPQSHNLKQAILNCPHPIFSEEEAKRGLPGEITVFMLLQKRLCSV